MTTIKLRKPVTAYGEEVKELTLREPLGEDLVKCGMPYRLVDTPAGMETRIDNVAIANFISALGGVPLATVNKLAAADFQEAMTVVMGFFGPGASIPAN
jgi:hypothetical protein